jgi:predicted alpha/beta-fold hydrolase
MSSYTPPWWLPGGHAQTIYASLFAPAPRIEYRRTRWETPDGDFIDLDWGEEQDSGSGMHEPGREPPLAVLFHGLEGSSRSHYARALVHAALARGWQAVVAHFRGCSGEPNRLARAYHSGDSAEADWILRRLASLGRQRRVFAIGVSLGGNVLLKWLGEQGAAARDVVAGAAAVSAPVDLMASGDCLGHGFNLVYARNFLGTMKRKSLSKLRDFPQLWEERRVRSARTLREFDDVVTAPLHGFRDTDDYWTRASSKSVLSGIAVPTLMINARNDPFLPGDALPAPHEVSSEVVLDFPAAGGHAGFVTGPFPGSLEWLPARVLGFFAAINMKQ